MLALLLVCFLCGSALAQYEDIAQDVLSSMDLTVDPCSDFYSYACGTWIKNTHLPSDQPVLVKGITLIMQNNELISKKVVEQPSHPKLNTFYSACMNMDIVNKRGIDPMVPAWNQIDQILSIGAPSNLLTAVAYLNFFGVNPFFTFSSVIDAGNPVSMIGQFSQGGLSLGDESLYTDPSNKDLIAQYLDHMTKMFDLAGVLHPDQWAASVLKMESALADITVPADQLTNPFTTYNKMSLLDLIRLTTLPWTSYFVELSIVSPAAAQNVIVDVPTFFEGFGKIVNTTTVDDWIPYLKWQLLNSQAMLLSQPIRDEHFRFFGKILSGQKEPKPMWRQCVDATDASLGELLGKYWVQVAFPGTSQTDSINLLNGIMSAMKNDLETITWMDETTRAKALDKLSKVSHQIGSPKNPNSYANVNVTATTYYENVMNATYDAITSSLIGIGGPKDISSWEMTPSTVNAYYDPTKNQMVFPAGILQQPYFNHTFPIEMQAAQVIMGHELTHGFDNQGRLYDGDGRLVDWWQPETGKKFDQKVKCVIDQFSKFEPLPGVFINGQLTQGENIADMGGTKNAYKAVEAALGVNGMTTPSLIPQFTRGQLFFIAYAQTWCEKASDEYIKRQVKVDPHSPAKFRVIGPLTNLQQFADTFKCAKGSPMNPTQRCEVW